MKRIIKKIAKSNAENKITLTVFALLAMYAVAMPSTNYFVNVIVVLLLFAVACIYINEEIKITDKQ